MPGTTGGPPTNMLAFKTAQQSPRQWGYEGVCLNLMSDLAGWARRGEQFGRARQGHAMAPQITKRPSFRDEQPRSHYNQGLWREGGRGTSGPRSQKSGLLAKLRVG